MKRKAIVFSGWGAFRVGGGTGDNSAPEIRGQERGYPRGRAGGRREKNGGMVQRAPFGIFGHIIIHLQELLCYQI
jgi:hypothetical protein